MEYKILLQPSAVKDLDKLPKKETEKISFRILQLKENPRPVGVQKLNNQEGYRIRSGHYRILYEIDNRLKIVHIYRVKHRKEANK